MKCLVTGGAGFIGSHLCENLLKEGHEVVCVDNFSTGNRANLPKNVEIMEADVNKDNLDPLFKKHQFEWVFHHAALVGVKRTMKYPIDVLNDVVGIKKVLDLCRKYDVKKALMASSSEVYGEPVEIPEVEDGHLNPSLPYAVTKLMGEKYFQSYYEQYGLPTCSLRFFNVYGPRQDSSDYGFVVGIFIENMLKNKPIEIFGDGTQTRDFVYIDDNIKATILAMEKKETNGEVINIGTGRPMTILDLSENISRLGGSSLDPIFKNKRDDVRHRFPDVSKMIRLLKFRPQCKVDEGLRKTIEYYKAKT